MLKLLSVFPVLENVCSILCSVTLTKSTIRYIWSVHCASVHRIFLTQHLHHFNLGNSFSPTCKEQTRKDIELGCVYTKRQRQRCNNSAMMLAVMFLLQTMESLQTGCTTHFQVTLLFSMRTGIASVIAEL